MILTSLRERNLSAVAAAKSEAAAVEKSLNGKSRTTRNFCGFAALSLLLFAAASTLLWRDARLTARTVVPSESARARLSVARCAAELPARTARPAGTRYVLARQSEQIRPYAGATACAQGAWPISVSAVDAGDCVEDGVGLPRRTATGALRCLPTFLVVGAQKAATGSLAEWLARHPLLRRARGPRGHADEPHYFDSLQASQNASRQDALEASWRDRYLANFPPMTIGDAAAGVSTFEKSPSYARYLAAVELASMLLPSAHVVFILREPVERALSAFAHHVRHARFARLTRAAGALAEGNVRTCSRTKPPSTADCEVSLYSPVRRDGAYSTTCAALDGVVVLEKVDANDFDAYVRQATVARFAAGGSAIFAQGDVLPKAANWAKHPRSPIDVVDDGDYATQLEGLYARFSARQVHVVLFDKLAREPLKVLDELQRGLGLPHHDFGAQLVRRNGRYDVAPARGAGLAERARYFLAPLFRPRIKAPRAMLESTRALLYDHYADGTDSAQRLLRDRGSEVTFPEDWPTRFAGEYPGNAHGGDAGRRRRRSF
ncbi:P-loop containing nucleoside triphosphate hydrolase protein [Pelagophyceae sp. CCMP2097]|nr:P-loop containing nucleoside triphosphate hydrolase protein [Pelagophyceae sp. CCMP2097]